MLEVFVYAEDRQNTCYIIMTNVKDSLPVSDLLITLANSLDQDQTGKTSDMIWVQTV